MPPGRQLVPGTQRPHTPLLAGHRTSRKPGARGGLRDPLIPVEVGVMLWLAPELIKAWFYVLVLHATLNSTRSIVPHCAAGYTSVGLLVY